MKVRKRQIHLLYDFICDINILKNLLQNYLHLALKRNMLSLKNFYEIKDGTLLNFLQKVYRQTCKHIQLCEV